MAGYTEQDKAKFAALTETYARIRAEQRQAAATRFWANVTRREIRNTTRTQPVGWF